MIEEIKTEKQLINARRKLKQSEINVIVWKDEIKFLEDKLKELRGNG